MAAEEEVINLDSTTSEEEDDEEEGEIQEDELNEIGTAAAAGDDPNEEDMDLGDDDVVLPKKQRHSSVVHTSRLSSSTVIQSSTEIAYTDQAPGRGAKRARVERAENEPSVRVVFSFLTRESKRKLMELMQQWSEWQAQAKNSSSLSTEMKEETLESGEEIYYSALQVGPSTSKMSTMSFWIDNQARTDDVKDESSVPLYDREFTLGSSLLDGSATFERSSKDDARCFNCGSYGHALKECPKPRDMAAINSARRQHSAKKNHSNSNHGQNRYYETKPEKYGDLKPGILSLEARECLGIREFDPPPWFHRMREMGYPPGYIEIVEEPNKPSGITIFTDEEEKQKNSDKNDDYEEGELPDQVKRKSPEKIMTVQFPGINAPIPEEADPLLWSVSPLPTPAPIYSPRYNSYDQYNGSSSQSPSLGRSLSDRGRYDGSSSQSAPSSYSYLHPYHSSNSDVPVYHGRDRERDRDRDRGWESHDNRRHHHHHRR